MRSLTLAYLALTLPLPCASMEWHEVEEMALDKRGRVESVFEIVEQGVISNDLRQHLTSYDPELRDGLGRTLKDIARILHRTEMLDYLESLPVKPQGASTVPESHMVSTDNTENTSNPTIPTNTGSDTTERTPSSALTPPASTSSQEEINQAMNLVVANQVGALRIKLEQGLDPNGFSQSLGRWLLEEAIMAKNEHIVDALIRAGADVNKVSLTEPQGKTMLMMAAALDEPVIAWVLLKNGANRHARGTNGATALHDACFFGSVKALAAMLPFYKDENFSPECSINGYPLEVMFSHAKHDRQEAVIECLRQAGFDFNDPRYSPPLIVSAFNNKKDHLVRTYLLAGADPAALDKNGKSTFDYLSDEQILLLYEVKEWLDEQASTSRPQR